MQETPFPQVIQKRLSPSNIVECLASLITGYTPDSEREREEPSYYDFPVLKAPTWHWEITWYFFFGGLAAGCYVIASIASLFGSREDRAVARTGYYLSLLSLVPCPPLLIKDLGRPERFLHMLRIFKVKSPMSMGTWGLVSFSFFSGITAVIQAARDGMLGSWWGSRLLAALPQRLLVLPGAGRAARPLVGTAPEEHGRTFWSFVFGGGLVLPWLLQTGSLLGQRSGKGHSGRGLVLALLVLVGGYFLRRTIIEAGQTSSKDARTTLWNAQRPHSDTNR